MIFDLTPFASPDNVNRGGGIVDGGVVDNRSHPNCGNGMDSGDVVSADGRNEGQSGCTDLFQPRDFLLVGGFVVVLAMQKWELHRRIALRIIMLIGVGPRKIIFGFMAATAFLSMRISNTATMMMVPIAMAIIARPEDSFGRKHVMKFSVRLLIGMSQLAKPGVAFNLIGVILVTLSTFIIGNLIFDITPGVFPSWVG